MESISIETIVTAFVVAASIPSAITGFCFWLIQRKIDKKERLKEAEEQKRREIERKREAARERNQILLVKSVGAAIALGEATAHAMQLGHPNGDMEAALKYAAEMKHEQKNFLTEQGIRAIYE